MDIPVRTTYDGRGIKKAQGGLAALAKSSIGTRLSIAALTASLTALGKASVGAALADAKAQAQLERVLANNGFAAQTETITRYIDVLQKATGVSEDQLRPAFQSLLIQTKDVTAAQDLLGVAMDTAAGTGKDLGTVLDAFIRGMNGSKRGFLTLETGLTKAQIEGSSLNEIIAALDSRFSGASAAAAESYGGQVDRLKISMGELSETVGQSLITAFMNLSSSGGQSLGELQADIDRTAEKIAKTVGLVGQFIGALGTLYNRINNLDNLRLGMSRQEVVDTIRGRQEVQFPASGADAARRRTEIMMAARLEREATTKVLTAQQKLLEKQERKGAAAAKASAAKKAAEDRARKAQELREKQKQDAANKLAMQFDIERAQMVAALQRNITQEERARVDALMLLNTLGYDPQLVKLAEIEAAIKRIQKANEDRLKQQEQLAPQVYQPEIGAIAAIGSQIERSRQAAFGPGRAAPAPGLFPGSPIDGFDPTLVGEPSGTPQPQPPKVDVTVQIGDQAVEAVVATAINNYVRNGSRFLIPE